MTTAHDFTLTTIRGSPKPLSEYAGKALLVVNVASECGYTPQYTGLEALHKSLAGRGLAILGVPCNQFGAQEPGTEAEIAAFCTKSYGVTFDLFSKVDVNGDNAHPLYRWLTDNGKDPIKWNFGKFVIGKDGAVVARLSHKVTPESAELLQAIERALG